MSRTEAKPKRRIGLVRVLNLSLLLDVFLVSAVTALVITRSYLAASGYPQIGGGGLHVSHMLFGGVLMVAAFLVMLLYANPGRRLPCALVAGIGFGLFIDEFGKFVTSNNDYFYRPTFAVIYVILIALYFIGQSVLRRHRISEAEYLVNAIDALKEAAAGGFDETAKETALLSAQRAGDGQLALNVREMIEALPARPDAQASGVTGFVRRSGARLIWFSEQPQFHRPLVAFFVFLVFCLFLEFAGILYFAGDAWRNPPENYALDSTARDLAGLSVVAALELVTAVAAAVLVTIGIRRLKTSPVRAYRSFERSLLLSLFVTQVMAFFASWAIALAALLLTLPAWLVIRSLIEHEQRIEK
jgi:hypothetical protein